MQENLRRPGRRRFLRRAWWTAVGTAAAAGMAACGTAAGERGGPVLARFAHGVASGDPLADRVILWTRVTPQEVQDRRRIEVDWTLARDPGLRDVVAAGRAVTGPDRDYTVKVDATGLAPGQVYWYGFSSGTVRSPVGRTKTLPGDDATQVRLAVFSCANHPAGFFHAYADAALHEDLDAALHLGDYLYEYESTGYACEHAEELGRIPEPEHQLLVLSDYRRRYAQYRTDPDLQALHARLPFIAVWDDHEFADDAWREGAAEHDDTRMGPFALRRAAAVRAYHEWMPIRAPDPAQPDRIYRSFDFGRILSLHMLDTRLIGRDQQIVMSSYYDEADRFNREKYLADLHAPHRRMLGAQQLAWLERGVRDSRAAWQVLGQQVLMARMEYPEPVVLGDVGCIDFACLLERAREEPATLSAEQRATLACGTLPCYLDSWDGYQSERERVFDIMRRHGADFVSLAGDTHNAWASHLHDRAGHCVGVEFACPSVSSPGLECSYTRHDPAEVARRMTEIIGPLAWCETGRRGYLVLQATREEVQSAWRFVDTVHKRRYVVEEGRVLRVAAGRPQIEDAG